MLSDGEGPATTISGHDAPSTHHEFADVNCRTNIVVSTPVGVALTGTSPERLSPCWKAPIIGLTIPKKAVANAWAASTGSPNLVVVEAKGQIAVSGCVTGPSAVVTVVVDAGGLGAGPH